MNTLLNEFVAAFLPLFVAVNLVGILPLFLGFTEGLHESARRRLTIQALTTAFVISLLILFAGQAIFRTLGITVNDLRVGGGLILLILSISDLVFGDLRRRDPRQEADVDTSHGIVPLGIPLIMGPAAITTILVSQQSYGYLPTLIALVANLLLVLVAFFYGPRVMTVLGPSAAKAIGKIASLFLAAIAVAMIRAGVVGMVAAL